MVDINFKELRAAIVNLNQSGLIKKKLSLVGVAKEKIYENFMNIMDKMDDDPETNEFPEGADEALAYFNKMVDLEKKVEESNAKKEIKKEAVSKSKKSEKKEKEIKVKKESKGKKIETKKKGKGTEFGETIGMFILKHLSNAKNTMSDEEIAAETRKIFNSRTTVNCVRWYRNKMKKKNSKC